MTTIFETVDFLVTAVQRPLVSREEGGHIAIDPKQRVNNRTELSPTLAIELMYLTLLIGEAMQTGLNNRGVDVARINYQDNGNWGVFKPEGPYLHVHLYGRAKSAKIQKYGAACDFPFRETGFYDGFKPLNNEDIKEIEEQIKQLQQQDKYQLQNWGLK